MLSEIEITIFPEGPAYTKQVGQRTGAKGLEDFKKTICSKSWSPFIFKHVKNYEFKKGKFVTGEYRSNDTSMFTKCFVLDFDEGLTAHRAQEICERNLFSYVIGATKSHQIIKGSKPACDRFRLILQLSRLPADGDEYIAIWNYFDDLFIGMIDSSCKDQARFYYPCKSILYENGNLNPVDVDSIIRKFKIQKQKIDTQTVKDNNFRGSLFDSTNSFLNSGHIEKSWHSTFFKAACDIRDQNYTIEEAREMLRRAARFHEGELDETDNFQLEDIYERKKHYPVRRVEDLNVKHNFWIDDQAYYGVIGQFVRMLDKHSEADPVGMLVQFLNLVGNVVGRNKFYRVESTKHFTNIFSIMVGKTAGGRKGTGFDNALEVIKIVAPGWYKSSYVSGGLASGEGLIHRVRDEEGAETTSKVDSAKRKKKLFVHESEFASILKVVPREGNTLSVIVRNAWDKGNLQNLSKNSKEKATDAHISINGHITKDELLRYLSVTETCNGFANRFLWINVNRSKILPRGGNFHKEDIQPYVQSFKKIIEFGSIPGEMKMTDEAGRAWDEIYHAIAEEDKEGVYAAITGRAEPYILRLSMIYAIADLSVEIKIEHLKAAKAVWDYCDKTCLSLFGKTIGDEPVDKILSFISNFPEGATRTQIRDLFNRNLLKSEIDRAIEKIEARGLGRRITREIKGVTTEYLVGINNDVH